MTIYDNDIKSLIISTSRTFNNILKQRKICNDIILSTKNTDTANNSKFTIAARNPPRISPSRPAHSLSPEILKNFHGPERSCLFARKLYAETCVNAEWEWVSTLLARQQAGARDYLGDHSYRHTMPRRSRHPQGCKPHPHHHHLRHK